MFIKRFPVIAVVLLLTVTLLGFVLSHFTITSASTLSSNPPPIQNHPSIHYTDGQSAIPPHKDGTLLAVADVQQYVSTHPFPIGPVAPGAHLKLVSIQLMTSKEASIQMRGEYIGLPDNALVYYVVVKGPFLENILSVTNPTGPHTFNLGEEAFDAKTGNLLVSGIKE